MTDAAFFERVVNEVMKRLREMNGTGGAAEQRTCFTNSLTIDERVVTLASVQGRLENVESLVVGNNAIVTPSVRDELRDRDITLVRSASQS